MLDLAVIGGGITGLAAAYAAERSQIAYQLLERETRLGGKVVSESVSGFLVEGGPDSFIVRKPWALELAQELGLGERVMGTPKERSRVYLLRRGRLAPHPPSMMLVAPTRVLDFLGAPVLSWRAKARMLLDLALPRRSHSDDESLASFVRRRFGQEAVERIAEPLMAGIHAGDPERLSLRATFPQFAHLEDRYGSVIRGLRRMQPGTVATQSSARVTLRGGVAELTRGLAACLPASRLLPGREVEALEPLSPGYRLHLEDGSFLEARAVILTASAAAAARLVAPWARQLASGLEDLRAVSTATVSLGLRRQDLGRTLDGMGYVIPRVEGRSIRACTWTSAKFEDRAPEGHVLLRVFLGGFGGESALELDDQEMTRLALSEIAGPMGLRGEPVLSRVHRWPEGIPQYEVGHLSRVKTLEDLCPPGLALAGSFFHGVGLPDCIFSGTRAVEKMIRYLGD